MTEVHDCTTVFAEDGTVVLVLDEHAVFQLEICLNLLRWLVQAREKQWQAARVPLGRPRRSRLPGRRALHDMLPDGYDREPEAGRFREYHEPWLRREILHAADRVATELAVGVPVRLSGEDLGRWIAVLSHLRLCYLRNRYRPVHRGRDRLIADFCAYLQARLVQEGHPGVATALVAAGQPATVPGTGPAPKS
ncbi:MULTISPECIES: DUF2017 family protein [unclassified Crossiella]|uniref:DUF2017 family protein n=1 Tax=unclassified Crossiella TaxID=2620835 RepID=UPI001FFEC717|nr:MULTISPECIES: DUF2017 family protein [unclassified Crossiella]MCK2245306.1 DUF2017 domain-containing protein [Crossiella sp. S99.2]MCK2258992.1 DUF2017 domain-containing protein [Crossiella sp. S99.1]